MAWDIISPAIMKKPLLPPLSKVFTAAFLLTLIGTIGLLFLFFFTVPTLGPRWLLFFFLTLVASGCALPLVYVFQRRIATQPVSVGVLIREAIWFGIFADLITWLQMGRVLNSLIALFLLGGFIVMEVLLRLSETSIFKPDEIADE